MAMTQIAHVIMNRGSGAGDKAALTQEIELAFKSYDWQVEFILVGGRGLSSQVRRAVAQASGVVVVAGGDGTINAVAAVCVEAYKTLGIIPAGTFNYVARNLGLPTDVVPAVSVIVNGHTRSIDIGEMNGRIFLNNAGLGLYARLIERREEDKRRFGRRRLVAFFSGLRSLLSPHPLYAVELVTDGQTERRLTTTLFFGCNARQLQDFNIAAAACLRYQKLAILSLQLRSRREIAVAACATLAGRFDALDSSEAFCSSTVRVQTRRRVLKVAIDGELTWLRPPLDVMLRPGGLQVLAPAEEHN